MLGHLFFFFQVNHTLRTWTSVHVCYFSLFCKRNTTHNIVKLVFGRFYYVHPLRMTALFAFTSIPSFYLKLRRQLLTAVEDTGYDNLIHAISPVKERFEPVHIRTYSNYCFAEAHRRWFFNCWVRMLQICMLYSFGNMCKMDLD